MPIRAARNVSARPAFWKTVIIPLFVLIVGFIRCDGATFTNNACIQISDPSNSLTSTNGIFTVSCWFRISIPSSQTLSGNMNILMDRTDGNEGANFSYLIRYNYTNNTVEFLTQGASGTFTPITLIQNPFLERWYYVAISRSGATFNAYLDGRAVSTETVSLGSTTGNGVSIGGIGGNSRQFSGDIIEVAIYSSALGPSQIQSRMFEDQRNFINLKGYYKLGYSTNLNDHYHNFAPSPPTGTDPANPLGSGTIAFNQVDEAGEQSLFDANLNHGQNAFTPLSGAFAWSQTALSRPVPGIAFDFQFAYSSALPTQPPTDGSLDPYDQRILGNNWRETFDSRVVYGPGNDNLDELDVVNWDGSVQAWTRATFSGPLATRDHEYKGELTQPEGSYVQWTTPERLVYQFDDPSDGNSVMAGRLEQISDFNGNTVQIQWNQDEGFITNVIDSAGGSYQFKYDQNRQLLTNVTFNAWQVNFAYDPTNRLISKSITNTSGLYAGINTTWQFRYGTNSLLNQIIDPRGNTNVFVQYDQYGRVTNEMDGLGRPARTEYDVPQTWQMRHTDAAGFQWTETDDTRGHVLSQMDPLGYVTSYSYDTNGNRISITEPLGWTTTFGYDARANVIAKTNALGEVTQWVFAPFFNKPLEKITSQPGDSNGWTTWTNYYAYDSGGNLVSNYDALGSLAGYTYSTNGLVLTAADGDGNITHFGYDTNGFLNSRTDPATDTTTYTLNDIGWKLHQSDALGNPTSYSYNLDGNLIRTLDPIGRVFTRSYDAVGNLLSQSDGKGALTTFSYDAANEKTNMTDRTGTNIWTYFYTARGKLDHANDPLGDSVTNVYDAADRLVAVSDPLGHSITNVYDANGNLIVFLDKLGQRWIKNYDRLDRVIGESDPLGDTKSTIYDVADRIEQIKSPNGYPSSHTYDGRGRLIKWVDPQNFPWLYAYDGVGNITNITDALGGHYLMAYDSRNERTMEKNQDGFVWQYSYDTLMRLQQQTDPDEVVRTPQYDNAGRRVFVNFSTGRQDSFTYDNNDNPQSISRRTGDVTTATQFIYDSLDRVVEQDDALNQTVLYGHDPLGRVTTITYPGDNVLTNTYDALGRLTGQVDWADRQTIYTYDLADRLISRTYPNGIVQTNAFDSAGRITSLSYTPPVINSNSINVALTYAYDRNGNKTGSGESGTFNWPMPSITADQTTFTAAGRLRNRQITETSPTNSVKSIAYNYDASGNMTNAAGDGQTWTLTYDEDNRTTSINWDCGTTAKSVANRYDALGRRISETVDGVTTGYVLDMAGGMENVLCDLDGDGNVTAYYIHGPDLCYRVDATNGLICYHADAMGNVIALTDGNTNLIAEYAYTPYGRSLGSTNSSSLASNPYLFVGSQGVQEESEIPNLYFMRARYYSGDAGVFLSTDSQKRIGPGWLPEAYNYGRNNPMQFFDLNGNSPISQTLGLVNYVEEFFNPMNLFFPASGLVVYGIGAAEQDQIKMNAGGGMIALPIQNVVSDIETGTGLNVNFSIGDVPINDQMAKNYYADAPATYGTEETTMNYGSFVFGVSGAASDAVRLASAGKTAVDVLSKGRWAQVGGYLAPGLVEDAASTLWDATGLLASSQNSGSGGVQSSGGSSVQTSISQAGGGNSLRTGGLSANTAIAGVSANFLNSFNQTFASSPTVRAGTTSSGGEAGIGLGASGVNGPTAGSTLIYNPFPSPPALNSGGGSAPSNSNPFLNAWNSFLGLFGIR